MDTQPNSVEQLAQHEQEIRSLKQQKKALKQERNAQRKLIYLKSRLSEKTFFRYIVLCLVSFFSELALTELVKADEFYLMASVCIIIQFFLFWWFGNGKSKTAIGEVIQLIVKWIGYVINSAAAFYLIYT